MWHVLHTNADVLMVQHGDGAGEFPEPTKLSTTQVSSG